MAPKRRTRASSPNNGLAPGQVLKRGALSDNSASPWAWVGTEAIEASQITLEHRLMSCGLSHRNRHPFCHNKLKPKFKAKEPLTSVAADDVIIISDDDEEPTCSKKSCKLNPNCLNYLNVDTWASRGQPFLLLALICLTRCRQGEGRVLQGNRSWRRSIRHV